jgi:chromosomal replication initiation ATPase DnaA
MTLDHPKVKKIIAQCERRVKKLTGNTAVLMMFYKKQNDLIPYETVVNAVCAVTGKTHNEVLKSTRKQEIVKARQLICFYANYYSNATHVFIAHSLGYKDHTTSVTGSRKIKDLIETGDPMVIKMVSQINKQLNIAV